MTKKYEGPERREHDWHLNKNVSVTIIFLLFVNLGSGVWFLSGLSGDVRALKQRPDLTERVIKLEAITNEQGRLLQKLDSTLTRFNNTITRIDKEQAKRGPLIYKK